MGKLILSLAVVLVVSGGAMGDMVSPTFNFSGSQQSITATLTASGSATLSGYGTYYSWVGWPVSSWASVTISMNNQTVGLGTNPNPINIDKDPMGNGQVSFERLFTTLDNGQLVDLNATDLFGGSPQNVALNRISLDGGVNTPLGDIPVTFNLDAAGSLSNFSFDMTTNPVFTMKTGGAFPSVQYTWIGGGNAGVNYDIGVTGEIKIWDLITVPLGTLVSLNDRFDYAGIPLLGTMTLTELAGPYPKDVEVHIASNFDQFTPVTVPFTTSGAIDQMIPNGSNSYFTVHADYAFNGSLTVDNVTLDIYSTITDIIPEPVTVAVFGVGAALFTMARRRNSR